MDTSGGSTVSIVVAVGDTLRREPDATLHHSEWWRVATSLREAGVPAAA